MIKLFCSILLAAVLTGCVTIGRPFRISSLPPVQLDQTTQQDIEKTLGAPYRTGIDDGDKTATWLHYKFYLGGEKWSRDLYVRFHDNGTVKSYSFNSNFPDDAEDVKNFQKNKSPTE
jgi:hypothetical protein